MELKLDIVPLSLNKLFRLGWKALDRYRKDIALEVGWAIKQQKLRPVSYPVVLDFEVSFGLKRIRDYDNYIGGAKFFIDPLREMKILSEDNSNVVKEIRMRFVNGGKDKTIIRIRKYDQSDRNDNPQSL